MADNQKFFRYIFFFANSFILSFLIFWFIFQLEIKYPQIFYRWQNDFSNYLIAIFSFFIGPAILSLVKKISRRLLFFTGLILPGIFLWFFINPKAIYSWLITNQTKLIAFGATLFLLTILFKLKKPILPAKENPFVKFFLSLLIFVFVFLLIFNPQYKYSFEKLAFYGRESFHQFHHVNFFIAPINEIILGKTLLVDADSQYGILLTYWHSLVFKIFGLSYSNFILYAVIITIIYSWLFFLLLRKLTNNYWLSFLGLVLFLKLAIFRFLEPERSIFNLPSTTPLRYFFDVVVCWLMIDFFKEKKSLAKIFILPTIVVLAFFYNIDFGLPILIAYLVALFFDLFSYWWENKKINQILKQSVNYFLPLEIVFIITASLIFLLTIIRSGHWPELTNYLISFKSQPTGLSDYTWLPLSFYHFPLFIYLIGYYFLLWKLSIKQLTLNNRLLVFLIVYGLIIYLYFIGLKEPNHLFTIIHPAIIIIILLFQEFLDYLSTQKENENFLTIIVINGFFAWVLVTIFFLPPNFINALKSNLSYHYLIPSPNYYYWNHPQTDFYLSDDNGSNFFRAAKVIKQLTKNQSKILIISRYDTLLYLMTQKTSLIDRPNLEYDIFYIEQVEETIKKILKNPPVYIFVYSEKYNQMESTYRWLEKIWTAIKDNYQFYQSAGAVDVYRLKNF